MSEHTPGYLETEPERIGRWHPGPVTVRLLGDQTLQDLRDWRATGFLYQGLSQSIWSLEFVETDMRYERKEDYELLAPLSGTVEDVTMLDVLGCEAVLKYLVPHFCCLNVLQVESEELRRLDDSLFSLRNLRYLNLRATLLESLPRSISGLVHLRSVVLRGCPKLPALPSTIARCPDLKRLRLIWCNSMGYTNKVDDEGGSLRDPKHPLPLPFTVGGFPSLKEIVARAVVLMLRGSSVLEKMAIN